MTEPSSYIRLYLAEYASVFSDGTVTMVRGFINHWTTNVIPQLLQPYMIVDMSSPSAAERERDFTFGIRAPSGLQVASVAGRLGRSPEAYAQYAIPLSFQVVEYGKHTLELRSEDMVGALSLDVRPPRRTESKP
jgi:hypothetical protein